MRSELFALHGPNASQNLELITRLREIWTVHIKDNNQSHNNLSNNLDNITISPLFNILLMGMRNN